MSSIHLVRHGQASIHADDYDQLSDLGKAQSRALGHWWAERGLRVDALYVGPQRRHAETEASMRAGALEGGLRLPEAEPLPGVGEMDASSIFSEALQRVTVAAPDLRDQLRAGSLTEEGRLAMRHMAGISAKLFERWAEDDPGVEMEETYGAFERRVVDAVQGVMKEQRRGKQVAIITSGGPICVALKLALNVAPPKAFQHLAVIYNASLTELKYTENALTLACFNAAGHLSPKQLTRV